MVRIVGSEVALAHNGHIYCRFIFPFQCNYPSRLQYQAKCMLINGYFWRYWVEGKSSVLHETAESAEPRIYTLKTYISVSIVGPAVRKAALIQFEKPQCPRIWPPVNCGAARLEVGGH